VKNQTPDPDPTEPDVYVHSLAELRAALGSEPSQRWLTPLLILAAGTALGLVLTLLGLILAGVI
jgi:hypothetical protein